MFAINLPLNSRQRVSQRRFFSILEGAAVSSFVAYFNLLENKKLVDFRFAGARI